MTAAEPQFELKPCPFCGGTNVEVFGPIGWYRQFGISHSCRTFFGGAGDFTIGGNTKEEAITAWNTRAPDSDLEAHIGAMLDDWKSRIENLWITADNDREEGYDEGLGAALEELSFVRPTALQALERVRREARVEGMRAAADACGQDNGPWLGSAWQCRETILRMIKAERGEAVTLPYDYSRCGITPANEACPLAARCARRTDPGRPTYQTYTAYPGGEDCYGFIAAERGNP